MIGCFHFNIKGIAAYCGLLVLCALLCNLFDFTLEVLLLRISGNFDYLHYLPSKPIIEKESKRQLQHPSNNIKIYCKERVWEEGARDREIS